MSRIKTFAALAALGLGVTACATPGPNQLTPASNPSLNSVHQPVVERTNFVFDVNAQGDRVSQGELERLGAWFESIELRYGDRLSVDDGGSYSQGARADIARLLAEYGLALEPGAPVTQGQVPQGFVRVVASRSTASVAGCPNWAASTNGITPQQNTSSNYGCATNANLAAMIANPEDLIHGRSGTVNGSGATAGRAIRGYREGQPTGRQGLTATTTTNQGR